MRHTGWRYCHRVAAHRYQRLGLKEDIHWGFDALHVAPQSVLDLHKQYLDAGAHILTTDTYTILDAPSYSGDYDIHVPNPIHWMDLARTAIELPRQAIAEQKREDNAVVAFSIGGEIENSEQQATMEFLLRIFQESPPDIILFETLSLIEDNLTFRGHPDTDRFRFSGLGFLQTMSQGSLWYTRAALGWSRGRPLWTAGSNP